MIHQTIKDICSKLSTSDFPKRDMWQPDKEQYSDFKEIKLQHQKAIEFAKNY